ncbi:hypothetical protein NPIL_685371 [Nephila pilipes]|uniref:Uncharacterized protein n=1 Tax=Nephila pilipes TaxID=299642 RepID=A0A8X6NA57_NEPPI|nr:hypothetical protein NPIL_685371 [Nephila pilipes]
MKIGIQVKLLEKQREESPCQEECEKETILRKEEGKKGEEDLKQLAEFEKRKEETQAKPSENQREETLRQDENGTKLMPEKEKERNGMETKTARRFGIFRRTEVN